MSSAYENFSREDLISTLVVRDQQVAEREQEIDKLYHLLIQAKKNLYGRKSEKLTKTEQQELFSFELPQVEELPLETVVEVENHNRKQRTKREVAEGIPRERVEYDLECTACPGCGKEMPVIGNETSEELELIPAQFKITEHVRLKRACGSCKNGVFIPKLPAVVKPLERRIPGPGLVAQVLVSKYCDHQPLHRQEQIFKRSGINLSRKLMCGWVEGAVDLLLPIYKALKKELMQESYLQADETTIDVQDRNIEGKLYSGYFWAAMALPNRVLYHYGGGRAAEIPLELFKDFSGRLQTDAYAGYNQVMLPNKCERIACLAHVRRKFKEKREASKTAADRVLVVIAELYKIERLIKDKAPEERYLRRKRKAFPLLKKLYRLISAQLKTTLPNSEYTKALRYAWNQRFAMLQYLRDGRYEIDNNMIENQMRPIALGRKNYLFAGSHAGAERAAILYSLINTCKLNKVDPWAYLRDVICRVQMPGVSVQVLLPHRWKTTVNMGDA
jgi:transposase